MDLSDWTVVTFVLTFSSTVSVGVVIGYLMNKYPSTDDATQATLLHFVTVRLVLPIQSSSSPRRAPAKPLSKPYLAPILAPSNPHGAPI